MPTTTRPTMKQSKCKHPAAALLRGVDSRYETCSRCGIVRIAPVPAPWLIAYDEANPPEAPVLFPSYVRPVEEE